MRRRSGARGWRAGAVGVCLGVLAVPGAASPAGLPEPLRAGQRVERPFAAGEELAFEIELAPAPAWRVLAVQDEVDVSLTVRGPDEGPEAREVHADGPVERIGPESILLVSPPAGRYEIVLRAPDDGGRGRVSVVVEELAADGDRGQRLLAAEAARSRGGEQAARDEAEATREALAAYREAAELWDGLGAISDAGWARLAAAYLARRLGETAESLTLSRRSAADGAAVGDAALEGWAANSAGLSLTHLGRHDEARGELERAIELHRATGSRFREATSRNNLCLTWHFQGDLDQALPCYRQSLDLFRSSGETAQEALVLNNLGGVHHVLAEPGPAIEHYRQAVEIHRAAGHAVSEAETLNNLAVLHGQLGEFQKALLLYERILELQRRVGDRRGEARALNNLGTLYERLGESDRALGYFEQALPLRREVEDPRGEATTLNNLGRLYRETGEVERALELHRRAVEIQRAGGERGGEAASLELIGRALVAARRPAEALASFDRSLALLDEVGDRVTRRRALAGRAEAHLALGDVAAAEAGHRQALALSREVLDVGAEVRELTDLAAIVRRTGHLDEAESLLRQAVELVESLRAGVFSPDLRASFGGSQREVYERLVDVLMERHAAAPGAGHERQALTVSEQARARTFLELVLEGGEDLGREIEPELAEARRALVRNLSAKARSQRRAAERGAPEDEQAKLDAEVRGLLAELDSLESQIRSRDPRYADLVRPPSTDVADIQALLDPGTVLVEYQMGDDRSFAWRVTGDAVEAVTLAGRAELDAAARRAHEELSGRGGGSAVAALAALVLAPLRGLEEAQRIVVVPDGALHYVPFAALPLPAPAGAAAGEAGEPLIAHAEIVHLPSATVLAVLRSELGDRAPAPRSLAVFADPVFDRDDLRVEPLPDDGSTRAGDDGGNLARLRMTRREAETIAALFPEEGRWLALDFAANRQAALEGPLDEFRLVHFATHGVLDAERPGLSGLILSRVAPSGEVREGSVHVHDVYGLSLAADLVVLSGCQTALGREIRGEGLVGLTRGFMHAGAARVVASLWQVQDRATAELMERFYRAMVVDGSAPAAALREAQLSVRKEAGWLDPYFWAGFVLQGDWRGPRSGGTPEVATTTTDEPPGAPPAQDRRSTRRQR